MTSPKRNKKNQTISFEDDIHSLLKEEADKHYNDNFSSALNNIIRYTIGLDDEVKKEIALFAKEKHLEYEQKSNDEKGFYKETFSGYSKQYKQLFELFMPTADIKKSDEGESMKKIKMKDSYLICPNDWILIGSSNEKLHTHAFVIEFLNGKKFNLPHFVFTTHQDKLSVREQSQYLEYASGLSKEFADVWNRYPVYPPKDISDEVPRPGFFEIPKLGTTNNYPFGAMVIDNDDTEKGGE